MSRQNTVLTSPCTGWPRVPKAKVSTPSDHCADSFLRQRPHPGYSACMQGERRFYLQRNICSVQHRMGKDTQHGLGVSNVRLYRFLWPDYLLIDTQRMMYSALNIRPHLKANERLNNSYFFLAIGFFNIVLPSFVPAGSEESKIFWHRARSVKTQTAKIAKNSCLVSRSKEMSKERGLRSRIWGMQDDGVECTLSPPRRTIFDGEAKAPSAALIGLSMLGNLDGIYKHPSFPSLKLHTLTTGSRQRNGGMLLFGYTFVGKLWLSLGYDVNGFDDDVVQTFWRNLLAFVDDFL